MAYFVGLLAVGVVGYFVYKQVTQKSATSSTPLTPKAGLGTPVKGDKP